MKNVAAKPRKEQKKELILHAAAQVFSQKGYAGALMADVAAKAGLGKGTLYEYFDSKEDLFVAACEWMIQSMAEGASVGLAAIAGTAAERLAAWGAAVIRQCDDLKEMFSLYLEAWAVSAVGPAGLKPRLVKVLREAYGRYRRLVAALIRDGMERGEFDPGVDPEAVAAFIVGGWDALFLQAWFDESFDPVATSDRFLTVLLRGLSSQGQGAATRSLDRATPGTAGRGRES
ncbi:MAG: TetR/AcrR family transcriptional regulator [Thermodesulfobacteriota bacterium]